jgi:aquaporin Z
MGLSKVRKALWAMFISEFLGTALLVAAGVSFVILDFGTGNPVAALLPGQGIRRLITGFLFGTVGATIALSPVGKVSGAHINPVVTLAFWMKGKMSGPHALGYVVAQLAGGILGAWPLLLWGKMGTSIDFGATLPGAGYSSWQAASGEIVTTFALIAGLFLFLGHSRLRAYTPALFPFLYALMVYWEAPVSGTSTNPARSLGLAVMAGNWRDWWVYWIGPLLGTLLALAAGRLPLLRRLEVEVAKIYHFEHDPHGLFHLSGRKARAPASSRAD